MTPTHRHLASGFLALLSMCGCSEMPPHPEAVRVVDTGASIRDLESGPDAPLAQTAYLHDGSIRLEVRIGEKTAYRTATLVRTPEVARANELTLTRQKHGQPCGSDSRPN